MSKQINALYLSKLAKLSNEQKGKLSDISNRDIQTIKRWITENSNMLTLDEILAYLEGVWGVKRAAFLEDKPIVR